MSEMIERASNLLGHVIAVADDVLCRPHLARHDVVQRVLAEIKTRHEKPSENQRRTYFAMGLMQALDHVMWARRSGDDEDARAWMAVAGTCLPYIRRDAFRALEDEKLQGSTTQE